MRICLSSDKIIFYKCLHNVQLQFTYMIFVGVGVGEGGEEGFDNI